MNTDINIEREAEIPMLVKKFLTEDYDVVAQGGDLTGCTLRNMLSRGLAIEPILIALCHRVRAAQKERDAQIAGDYGSSAGNRAFMIRDRYGNDGSDEADLEEAAQTVAENIAAAIRADEGED